MTYVTFSLRGDEEGARALPERETLDNIEWNSLRLSIASLVGAMRDLLSNIQLPDMPNDADVDENDDDSEEEGQNNYLT